MLICIVKGATDVICLADKETFLNCFQWAVVVLHFQRHYNVFIGCFVLELKRDQKKECLWVNDTHLNPNFKSILCFRGLHTLHVFKLCKATDPTHQASVVMYRGRQRNVHRLSCHVRFHTGLGPQGTYGA